MKRWALGMKIKKSAEELYLEPDVDGRPAHTLAAIVTKLKEQFPKGAANLTPDLITRWANETIDGEPYTWYELRIISRTSPSIRSTSGGQGMSWKELIYHKIEQQDVMDRQAAEMVKAKTSLAISDDRDQFKPSNLIEAVSLQQAAENKTRPKRVVD